MGRQGHGKMRPGKKLEQDIHRMGRSKVHSLGFQFFFPGYCNLFLGVIKQSEKAWTCDLEHVQMKFIIFNFH